MPAADAPPKTTAASHVATRSASCDVCGGPTYEARCKIICRRCGYTRDCSDP